MVNITTSGEQTEPAIAALDGGGWMIAWQSGTDIVGRRLTATGSPVTESVRSSSRTSALPAIAIAAGHIAIGSYDVTIAGGVESMSRAPFVMGKQATAFGRDAELHDTTLGWRFVNPRIEEQYGLDSMAETAENVADGFLVSRTDQDAFALRSQQRAATARNSGLFAEEIVPVTIPQRRGDDIVVDVDEHPRPDATLEALAGLSPIVRPGGTITAGNASGINDGACAMVVATEDAARRNHLEPLARVVGWAVAGVEPRIMGIGPAPAAQKVLEQCGLSLEQMDVIELNEAFAAQGLATLRQLGIRDDADHVNPNGGAIALGHPLGMSGVHRGHLFPVPGLDLGDVVALHGLFQVRHGSFAHTDDLAAFHGAGIDTEHNMPWTINPGVGKTDDFLDKFFPACHLKRITDEHFRGR